MSRRFYSGRVSGAPVQVGEEVVVGLSLDETFDLSLIARKGIVLYLEYDTGCADTFPGDPMIRVRFEEGTEDSFWGEELVPANAPTASVVSQLYELFRPIIEERVPILDPN